jgi:hypothetical protein
VRVGVRVDVRASGWGACSAAHIIFIPLAIEGIQSITALPLERWLTIGGGAPLALLRPCRAIAPIHVLSAMAPAHREDPRTTVGNRGGSSRTGQSFASNSVPGACYAICYASQLVKI